MWKQVKIPQHGERMIGYTIPQDQHVVVISYDGIHVVDLRTPERVQDDDRYAEGMGVYDPDRQELRYEGATYRVLGLDGGAPITRSTQGEQLELDIDNEVLRVLGPNAEITLEYEYADASGDWRYATFSDDFQYVLLGVPYDLNVFKREG